MFLEKVTNLTGYFKFASLDSCASWYYSLWDMKERSWNDAMKSFVANFQNLKNIMGGAACSEGQCHRSHQISKIWMGLPCTAANSLLHLLSSSPLLNTV